MERFENAFGILKMASLLFNEKIMERENSQTFIWFLSRFILNWLLNKKPSYYFIFNHQDNIDPSSWNAWRSIKHKLWQWTGILKMYTLYSCIQVYINHVQVYMSGLVDHHYSCTYHNGFLSFFHVFSPISVVDVTNTGNGGGSGFV